MGFVGAKPIRGGAMGVSPHPSPSPSLLRREGELTGIFGEGTPLALPASFCTSTRVRSMELFRIIETGY